MVGLPAGPSRGIFDDGAQTTDVLMTDGVGDATAGVVHRRDPFPASRRAQPPALVGRGQFWRRGDGMGIAEWRLVPDRGVILDDRLGRVALRSHQALPSTGTRLVLVRDLIKVDRHGIVASRSRMLRGGTRRGRERGTWINLLGHRGRGQDGVGDLPVTLSSLAGLGRPSDADGSGNGRLGRVGRASEEGRAHREGGARWRSSMVGVRGGLDGAVAGPVPLIVDRGHRRRGRRTLVRTVLTARLDAHHGGLAADARLDRDRVDNGVVAVDGRGDATAAQTRGHAVARKGGLAEARVGRGTELGHEEVLIGMRAGRGDRMAGLGASTWRQRRDGRDQETWGRWRRPIGDAGDVGDLDEVGGSGEDGRGGRADGVHRGPVTTSSAGPVRLLVGRLGLGPFILFLVLLLVPAPAGLDAEAPDQAGHDGDQDDAADDPTGDGADIRAGRLGQVGIDGGRARGVDRDASHRGALGAGLARQRAGLAGRARVAGRRDGRA